MRRRGNDLADCFERANSAVIATVAGCSDEQWQRTCNAEGWSVGVTAHHLATAYPAVAGFVQLMATGQPLPNFTGEMLDAGNAEHARKHANCSKAETLEMLRQQGQAAAELLRGLSDEQLDRSAPVAFANNAEMSAQQITEMVLIGHPQQHCESIKQAVGT